MGQGYGRDGPYGGEGGGGHNAPAPVYAPPPEEAVETLMVRQLQVLHAHSTVVSYHVMSYIFFYVLACYIMSCDVLSCHSNCTLSLPAPLCCTSSIASHTNSLSQGMGFDRPAVLAALQSNGNSVEAAANMLLR
jgi:hypothetical protein